MAISKIKSGSIIDNAVNTNKLAPASVGSSDISTELVTGLTELSETAADADFTLIFDTSAGVLKKILRSNLKQVGPTISSVSPTNANESNATFTLIITGIGFTVGSNARLIDINGRILEFDTVTRNSTTQITATIATSSLSALVDPYDVQVTNGEGLSSILLSQINFNASPVFITASGSLGSDRISMASAEVNATDPESAGNVTFEIITGSLPAGISLVNTGANGGTATFTGTFSSPETSETIYNFTLRASDAASNTSTRSFSFTALGPQVESFTSSGTFNVPTGLTSVDVLVVAGGGGGGPGANGGGGGGAGAGGLIFRPAFPVTPGGTITVTVGEGAPSNSTATNGQDSVFDTLTAKGGGYGGKVNVANGGAGGSGGGGSVGGGGGWDLGPATQPTQPGDSGAYGFGNAGGGGAPNPTAAGGGGANASGQPGPAGSAGGAGKSYTIADGTTPVFYAGGGGGAPSGAGGQGGGGSASGNPGTANRGGGGAGSTFPGPGGGGGKGIVIVSY